MSVHPARRHLWQTPWIRAVIFWLVIFGSEQLIQFAARRLGVTRSLVGSTLTYLCMASTAMAMYLTLVQRLEQRLASELLPVRAWPELLAGIGLGGLLISVVMLVLWLAGAVRLSWSGQVTGAVLAGGGVALSVAIIEELLMRGVLFRILAESLGWRLAMVVSALLFGALHSFNAGATLFGCLAVAIEGGVLFAAAFMYTRRLWLPIGLHLGWNFFEGSFYGAKLSGTSQPTVFASQFSGHELLTGGRFGPEASLVAVLVCGATGGALLLRALNRR